MTQETDQNHGTFKPVCGRDLRKLTKGWLDASETINLKAVDAGSLVFGGTDEVAGISGHKDAFAKAFLVERNERSWEMV